MVKRILGVLVCATFLTACGTDAKEPAQTADTAPAAEAASSAATEPAETPGDVTVKVLALKGPTAMGMVHIMDDADNGRTGNVSYRFSVVPAVDEVAPAIAKGEADIAAVPANLAAVLYNNTEGAVKVLDINTLGVLYLVEGGDTIASVSDLKGRTLYASGRGATPEYALQYVLAGNGLDPEADLTIEWKSEHAECVAALLNDPEGVAMLPQPFVTTAMTQNGGLRVALDLTAEWANVQGDEEQSVMVTGVTVVRTGFLEEHPEAVADFLARHADSAALAVSDVDGTAALVGAYEIVPEAVAKQALPACNIVCISGNDMKTALGGYLRVLYDANPGAVGGTLPDDSFYVTE